MRRLRNLKHLVVLGLIATLCQRAEALPPPPGAPFTLWNFLGIPQGLHKIRDATSNRRGNFPGMERKPPLKALADPANLQSKNNPIKTAAEIKTAEDEAPQKIKAIKYLATVGCGCYPGVKDALLDALDDCTEEVRYQTVLAIQDAAQMHCDTCGHACCCDEELTKRLAEIAYERNDKGCWLEPSERVREAAKQAMCACCPGQGPIGEEVTPEPAPDRPETIPTPADQPTPPEPSPEGEADRSARRLPPVKPELITRDRVRQALTSARTPSSEAKVAEVVESEEVVTIDFGNGPQSERVTSTRREVAPLPSAAPLNTIPNVVPRQNQSGAAPARRVVPTAKGPSSRRSAAARGLTTQGASELANHDRVLERTPATSGLARLPNTTVAYASDLSQPPTGLKPKAPPAPVAPAAPGELPPSSPKARVEVRGAVARVSKDAGTVEVRIENAGDVLNAGDRLVVSHAYLLADGEALGYIEVVSTGPRGVVARPVGKLTIERINRGDEVRLETAPGTVRADTRAVPKVAKIVKPELKAPKSAVPKVAAPKTAAPNISTPSQSAEKPVVKEEKPVLKAEKSSPKSIMPSSSRRTAMVVR